MSVLVAESARAAGRARRRHGEPGARGGRVGGCRRLGRPTTADRWRRHGDLLENGRRQLKPGQNTRQSPDSQLADRPPDSPHRHAGSCRASGRPRPRRRFRSRARIQGRGRAAVPAVRVESLGWTLVGGRRQLLRLLGVDVRSCNQQRSHRGRPRPFPRRGAKVGVDAYTGEVSQMLGGLIHEDHAVTA
jgi:hypothetical protein